GTPPGAPGAVRSRPAVAPLGVHRRSGSPAADTPAPDIWRACAPRPSEVLGEVLLRAGLELRDLGGHGRVGVHPPGRRLAWPGLDGFELPQVVTAELPVADEHVWLGLRDPEETVVGLGDPPQSDQEEAALEVVPLPFLRPRRSMAPSLLSVASASSVSP